MANNEQDLLWVYNPTRTPFEVKWGGYPYRLESGEQRIMPRFIAEHFAKHLTDAILLRKEEDMFEQTGKRTPMLQHPVERPKIVNLILRGVYSQHQPQADDAGAQIAHMVENINQAPSSEMPAAPVDDKTVEDYGFVPDRATGNLARTAPALPDTSAVDDIPPTPADPTPEGQLLGDPVGSNDTPAVTDPKKTKRTRAQLIAEADQLGIEYNTKTTNEQLERAIQNF